MATESHRENNSAAFDEGLQVSTSRGCTNARMHESTNTRIHECTNARTWEHKKYDKECINMGPLCTHPASSCHPHPPTCSAP